MTHRTSFQQFLSFSHPSAEEWREYLHEFHSLHPGITEDVLRSSRANGINPYEWLADALPETGAVLDLACGSAPTYGHIGAMWFGLDVSQAELARAHSRGARPLLCADASHLPFASGVFDAVICSMAIMMLQPLASVLCEIRRVLRDGGQVAFMLPGSLPLKVRDVFRYGHLMIKARKFKLAYPNDHQLRLIANLVRQSGFEIVNDCRVRFAFPMPDSNFAQLFADSLYFPRISKEHFAQLSQVCNSWVGTEIGIPLRRIILRAV